MESHCEQCPNAEPGVACYNFPTCRRTEKMSAQAKVTARDVLLYLFSECTKWEEDVDGDTHDDGTMYTIVNHTVRLSDSLLDELMDMAGMTERRSMETTLDRLKRYNDEDLAKLST